MYKIKFTGQFKKELKLAKKQGKDINKLFKIVDILAQKKVLDIKYKDHALISNYKGFRECHIEPDLLLIWKQIEEDNIIFLDRLGSHAELFG